MSKADLKPAHRACVGKVWQVVLCHVDGISTRLATRFLGICGWSGCQGVSIDISWGVISLKFEFPSVIFESLLFTLTVHAMLSADRRRSLNTLSHILFRDGKQCHLFWLHNIHSKSHRTGMVYFIVVSCKPSRFDIHGSRYWLIETIVCSLFSLL